MTNTEFKKFLDATHYRPKDDHNFLRSWQNGAYPDGWDNEARHLGVDRGRARLCRLGRQTPAARVGVAVRGPVHRPASVSVGTIERGRAAASRSRTVAALSLADVGAFAKGASPFGIMDLEGSVSQWTDEYRDPYTRAAIVRVRRGLPSAGLDLVFPANLPAERAPEIFADVAGP